jgi:ethanolamine phosphate phosphodiesterase
MFHAPGYADEDSKRHGRKKSFEEWVPIPGRSLAFAKKFAAGKSNFTIVFDALILSRHWKLHIRTLSFYSVIFHCIDNGPDRKNCGPLWEKGTLRPGVGVGYQNTLEKKSTLRLLQALNPVAIFRLQVSHPVQVSGSSQTSPAFVWQWRRSQLSWIYPPCRPSGRASSALPRNNC